jgi:hypothetical protein
VTFSPSGASGFTIRKSISSVRRFYSLCKQRALKQKYTFKPVTIIK